MAGPAPEIEGASIVILGSLNPAIFQPAWLSAKELLDPTTAESAQIEAVSRDVTVFRAGWLSLMVDPARFTATCQGSPRFESLRDLVVGAFTLLEHTPVKHLGLNLHMHFRMPDEEALHALGDRLAPKEPWSEVAESPRLRSITMLCRRPAAERPVLNVKVEPSTQVRFGAHVEVNSHYADIGPSAADATPLIRSEFAGALRFASELAAQLVGAG